MVSGCSKKDMTPPVYDSLGRINQWILDSMKRYYYWGDAISAKPVSAGADVFFKSILSVNDRFSWISNGQDIHPPSNSYFTYGFHYILVQVDGYQGLIGVVTSVNKSGAADLAGFKRGSYFIAVNGEKITDGNMAAVNLALRTPLSLKITPATYDNNEWKPLGEIVLSPGFISENPARNVRTFESNGLRTGYLSYSSFDEFYDAEMLDAMNKLKAANITELILDIRYNAGGSVASSAKLAALIANKLNANETYAIYAGNHFEGKRSRTLQEVLNTSGNTAGRKYEDLKPMQLSLNRIFILTTGGTMSAADSFSLADNQYSRDFYLPYFKKDNSTTTHLFVRLKDPATDSYLYWWPDLDVFEPGMDAIDWLQGSYQFYTFNLVDNPDAGEGFYALEYNHITL
jgi:hypothetical protein